MYYIYTQSRSNHPRGFTGTLLRAEIRTRSGHTPSTLTRLIDLHQASQKLKIAPVILQAAAEHHMIPHYRIAGHVRFDPVELNQWVKQHRIDELGVEEGLG